MLLTLAANSLRSRLTPKKGRATEPGQISLTDLPRYTRDQLGLFGVHLTTPLLAGADNARLDAIREAADKAPCPCLVLTEPEPLALCTVDDRVGDQAIDRMNRIILAASRLGCNSIGITIADTDNEDAQDFGIERLRRVIGSAERLEINILIAPGQGLTADPEPLTDFIKKVGGFRVGTFPDFETASKAPDPIAYLRKLVPYASAVTISTRGFTAGKKPGEWVHTPYDLLAYIKVVEAVGYQGTLAIDYRGEDDPIEGIKRTKQVLESVLSPPEEDDLDEDDLLDLPEDIEEELEGE